jgi:hypothetical protein
MLALWTPAAARAAEASDAAGTTASALAAGDAAAAAFDIEGAVRAYRAGVDRDSTSSELWWRLARSYTDRGARAEYDGKKDQAEPAYNSAVHAARKATALAPDGANGHLELAASRCSRAAATRSGSPRRSRPRPTGPSGSTRTSTAPTTSWRAGIAASPSSRSSRRPART